MPPTPKPRLEWNDPDLQIVPKRVRKKVYRPTIDKIEDRQKNTIRKLKNKIKDGQNKVIKARIQRDKAKATKKEHTKKALIRSSRYKRYITKRYIARMWQRKYEFANEIIEKRLKKSVVRSSNHLGAISSFPIIYSWCKDHKINHTTFGLFVLINHYEWFTPADGIFFGHTKATTAVHLKRLMAIGLVDMIRTGVKKTYLSSTLGKATFIEFKKYHDSRMKELMDTFSKTIESNGDVLEIRKYRKITKPETDADKQEDTQ